MSSCEFSHHTFEEGDQKGSVFLDFLNFSHWDRAAMAMHSQLRRPEI
jgi:hypothetical protein